MSAPRAQAATRWIPSAKEEIDRYVKQLRVELDDSTFAGRLRLVRFRLGLSVHQASKLCDLDNGSWHNWEKGGTVRGLEGVVRKIVAATECDGDWLLRGDQTPCFNQARLWPVIVRD